jgi:folate-dependent phosphoribosylglycinamide formyltransferase PurN
MAEIEKDARLNRRLIHDRPGRRFVAGDDARWGELVLPAPGENPDKTDAGLRLVVFASFEHGYLAFETAKAYERRYTDKLNLVALVTDDPANADAKIGVRKRIWKLLDEDQRLDVETATVESALTFGVPVYTGEVKVDGFRQRLAAYRPDAIIVCGFGQVIDTFIIELPPCGIYNFHPSDLAHGHGAGPAPYEDLAAADARTTVWTVHHVSQAVDAGAIVGWSPPVNICDADDTLPADALPVYNKLLVPLDRMVFCLIDELVTRSGCGETGPIDRLDFPKRFPDVVQKHLLEPVTKDLAAIILPAPDPAIFGP